MPEKDVTPSYVNEMKTDVIKQIKMRYASPCIVCHAINYCNFPLPLYERCVRIKNENQRLFVH